MRHAEVLLLGRRDQPFRVGNLVGGGCCLRGKHCAAKAADQIGHQWEHVKDINSRFCCTGTLGSLVTKNGKQYILSNNHVLARSNAAKMGEAIMQRGYVDTVPPCSMSGTINVANLSQFVALKFTGNNTVDAAIAEVIPGKVSSTGTLLQIGNISSSSVNPKLSLGVEKSGRTTAKTTGTINMVDVTVSVTGYGSCGTSNPKTATFVNQFTVTASGMFSGGGDSGSLIVTKPAAGKKPNPVGLLFAGSSTSTVGNPINVVLSSLGVTFVGTADSEDASDNAADQEVERVSNIKDRYDDYLMHLPGVVGHGVALAQDGSGRTVIRLLLDTRTASDYPTELEGVPVETELTGEFRTGRNCNKLPAAQ
jgi:hypothetical protein